MSQLHFEYVLKFKDEGLPLPVRATKYSAGYDFYCAQDTVVPSYIRCRDNLKVDSCFKESMEISEVEKLTKQSGIKPTLVSTGLKAYLDEGTYLTLVPRSSLPLKSWLVCANSTGIIDADYADNPSNEGEIFLQLINFAPFDIIIPKGTKICQGIICNYYVTEDDAASGERGGGFGSTGN